MSYPTTLPSFSVIAGTTLVATDDHANRHNTEGSAIVEIATTLGTMGGTNILKDFTAGQFPARVNAGGTIVQTLMGGTINNSVMGTPAITGGTASSITIASPIIRAWDGWNDANETWTYASANTITVPSGAASKYAVGDRIKWTQTTVKYGVITAVADTVLTIAVNTDYTVANAAITLNYYSHEVSPIGYPQWFNLTAPTFSVTYFDDGAGGQPTTTAHRFSITGRTVSLHYGGSGTKAGTDQYIVVSASTMPTPINQGEAVSVLGPAHMGDLYQGNFCLSSNPYIVIGSINIPDNTAITDFSYDATYEI